MAELPVTNLQPIKSSSWLGSPWFYVCLLEARKFTSNTGTISTKLAQQLLGGKKYEESPWAKYYRPDPELAR